jgi:hypothetical protein
VADTLPSSRAAMIAMMAIGKGRARFVLTPILTPALLHGCSCVVGSNRLYSTP